MIIAQKKRKENIAEYLLYMWQVEDLVRAAGVSPEGVEQLLLPRYDVDEEKRAEIRSWYFELIEMMRTEGKVESGHLDVNRIVLMQLEELHRRLISNPNDIVYSGLHLQILPALSSSGARITEQWRATLRLASMPSMAISPSAFSTRRSARRPRSQ